MFKAIGGSDRAFQFSIMGLKWGWSAFPFGHELREFAEDIFISGMYAGKYEMENN